VSGNTQHERAEGLFYKVAAPLRNCFGTAPWKKKMEKKKKRFKEKRT
jgi:hypothetical protein